MQSIDIKVNERIAKVDLVRKEGSKYILLIDGKEFVVDAVEVENGVYSILFNDMSYNVEFIEGNSPQTYVVNTWRTSFVVEVIDAASKYRKSRLKHDNDDVVKIASPMPGKVVKVLVKKGDRVKAGETVVVVSAMKMESEYKVKKDRLIKDVLVNEGDTVAANQTLIVVE